MATPQLLKSGGLDYLVYDYLAEITMSIMARARAKDPTKGYATDFIDFVLRPNLAQIAKSGTKIIANAGGVNPQSCGEAVRALIKEKGLDLKVAIITGDDLSADKSEIANSAPLDMFNGAALPAPEMIASINVYLGAFPIAKALNAGADIVITGRCVDSAVTLGACIAEFGWQDTDWDRLASGSLAGHILECGPQATGGNFTDWREAGDIANIGYPIVQIACDGSFSVSKPEGTGGIVNVGTISEQMLYEIGDPQCYILPDVICDFSGVTIFQNGENCVAVSTAKGRPAPKNYKTCLTYMDGYRAGTYVTFYGADAQDKAAAFAEAVVKRAEQTLRQFNLGEFTQISNEILGAGSQYGRHQAATEVVMKMAVKHSDIRGAGIFLKELAGTGLATPPGLCGFTGIRPKPSPIVRLFSYLTPKQDINIAIDVEGRMTAHVDALHDTAAGVSPPDLPAIPTMSEEPTTDIALVKLAWARSGDKGDTANVGVIARKPQYLPYIWAALSIEEVAQTYAHFMESQGTIERYYLPGSNAINFVIDDVLGGGGAASLRNDAQGKGYGQILLSHPIAVPISIAEALS